MQKLNEVQSERKIDRKEKMKKERNKQVKIKKENESERIDRN